MFEKKIEKIVQEKTSGIVKAVDSLIGRMSLFEGQMEKLHKLYNAIPSLMNDKRLEKFLRDSERPDLEEKWKASEQSEAKRIDEVLVTKGEEIRARIVKLHDEILRLQRQKQQTGHMEVELKTLKWVIE